MLVLSSSNALSLTYNVTNHEIADLTGEQSHFYFSLYLKNTASSEHKKIFHKLQFIVITEIHDITWRSPLDVMAQLYSNTHKVP